MIGNQFDSHYACASDRSLDLRHQRHVDDRCSDFDYDLSLANISSKYHTLNTKWSPCIWLTRQDDLMPSI